MIDEPIMETCLQSILFTIFVPSGLQASQPRDFGVGMTGKLEILANQMHEVLPHELQRQREFSLGGTRWQGCSGANTFRSAFCKSLAAALPFLKRRESYKSDVS